MEMIKLESMDMSEVEEDFDKILENHVTHHQRALWMGLNVTHYQRALHMELDDNNFSEKFVEKWRSRCEEIPSINCIIN